MSAPDPSVPSLPPKPPVPLALPPLQWGMAGLRAASGPGLRWLWHGYLAHGALTLLTSQWKTGKTTLVSVLLSRLKAGGQLAGLPLASTRAVVISEESSAQWLQRGQRLDLEDHVGWYCRPFRGRPNPEQWRALLDRVADEAVGRGVGLAVVDPLAAFFPGKSENDAGAMLDALAPLQTLTAGGLSVLALHHPGKKETGTGPSGRGSGALLGCADILIEMRWYRRAAEIDRRRRLIALSRFDETPRQLVVELNAEGTDYRVHGSLTEEEAATAWRILEALLLPANRSLTRAEIRSRWPAEDCPDPATFSRWLRRAVADGRLRQSGRGSRSDPYRYWLPAAEHRWITDPMSLFPDWSLPPPTGPDAGPAPGR